MESTDPVIDSPTPAPAMPSRTIARRALTLPVADWPGPAVNHFVVASGSTPGKTYEVYHDDVADTWHCDCIGGQSGHDCSHVWAARAHADPAVRRALLAIVRPARRMSTAAAERLVARALSAHVTAWDANEAAGYIGTERTRTLAVRAEALAATIVARLTGHPSDDDGEGAA